MIVEWLYLAVAVVLLLVPLPMKESERRYVMRSRRNATSNATLMLPMWQNWVDLVRAGVGAYVLVHLAIRADPAVAGAGTKLVALHGSVLAAGLLVQSVRVGEEFRLICPIFYLCGLTLVLSGYDVGGFAVFVGWLFAVGGGRAAYQLPIMGVALAAGAYTLGNLQLPLILNVVLIFLPLFLAFVFRQPMAYVARMPKGLA